MPFPLLLLGGQSPAELKFGTTDYHRFNLPLPLVPGNNYSDLVQELDHNLATVRAITTAFQQSLRTRLSLRDKFSM